MEQQELEALVRQMYEEIGEMLKDPNCGRVATEKITALYGPPISRPKLALISFQGRCGRPIIHAGRLARPASLP